MRTRLKISVLLGFSIVAIFLFTSNPANANFLHSDNGIKGNESSPRSLFMQNCARCHGVDGRAQTRLGKKLEAADLTSEDIKGKSTARIIRTITNGKLDMPAFGKKLTRQQISSIAGYIRSL